MFPLARVFTCGFNTTLFRCITVLKCVNDCSKIILGARLVADVKLQFPGLHAHLTEIFLNFFFYGDIGKIQSLPVQSIPKRKYGVECNNLQMKCNIHLQYSNALKVSFFA
jgi:hypothetical protein